MVFLLLQIFKRIMCHFFFEKGVSSSSFCHINFFSYIFPEPDLPCQSGHFIFLMYKLYATTNVLASWTVWRPKIQCWQCQPMRCFGAFWCHYSVDADDSSEHYKEKWRKIKIKLHFTSISKSRLNEAQAHTSLQIQSEGIMLRFIDWRKHFLFTFP